MTKIFLFGVFEDKDLQKAVFGQVLHGVPAVLDGHSLVWDGSWRAPWLVVSDTEITGFLVELDDEAFSRLAFYAVSLDASQSSCQVMCDGRIQDAHMFSVAGRSNAKAWDLADWQTRWQALVNLSAADLMKAYGEVPIDQAQRVMSQIMVRASSNLRAASNSTAMTLRHGFTHNDVHPTSRRRPYLDYFMIEEQDLTFKRFDGSTSQLVKRAAFVSGYAVTVLPYDPVRDRVLLIEQFRVRPLMRGDKHPWSVEVIAGRIDAGETPEMTAMREAAEETELTLQSLEHIGNYYPSPGAVVEYLYSYVGMVDLPDGIARISGLDSEAEDIRGILLSFVELMGFLASGEAENGPLILSAYWLAANRDRLRANA